MGDEGDLTPADIRRWFDASLEYIRIRSTDFNLAETTHPWHWVLKNETGSVDSWLRVDDAGLHLLVGRNGSGKSQLISALTTGSCANETLLTPSLIFRLPSEVSLDEWFAVVDAATQADWFRKEVAASQPYCDEIQGSLIVEGQFFSLPVMQRVIHQLTGEWMRFPDWLRQVAASAGKVLAYFGFDQEDIDSLVARNNAFQSRWPDGCLEDLLWKEHGTGVPASFSHRPYAAAWFLHASRTSYFSNEDDDGWHFYPDSTRWITDPALATLLGGGVSQLFRESTWVEVNHDGAIRLIAPAPQSGPLHDLLVEQQRAMSQKRTGRTTEASFPFDLFSPCDVEGRGCVATCWMNATSRSGFRGDPPLTLRDWIGIDVLDLTNDVPGQIHREFEELADHVLRVTVTSPRSAEDSDSADLAFVYVSKDTTGREESPSDADIIQISGYQSLSSRLELIARMLDELSLGVGGLSVSRLPRGVLGFRFTDRGRGGERTAGRRHGLLGFLDEIVLQWRQPETSNWLDVEQASQGQRDAMLVLLALCRPILGRSSSRALSDRRIVLIDEVDQHLHPTATTALLERAHELARMNGHVAIFSTHSVPAVQQASLRQAPRIYAQRTLEGLFSYTQSPTADLSVLTEILGVNPLDVLRLIRLFVLVEGEHDEIVLRRLFEVGGAEPLTGLDIVNARGTWAYSGVWANVLRFHDAPVLVTHDKMSESIEALETEWDALRIKVASSTTPVSPWEGSVFAGLSSRISDRETEKRSKTGDDEAKAILDLIRAVLPSAVARVDAKGLTVSHRRSIGRLNLVGLDCHDIVDLLPIEYFGKVADCGSWEVARSEWEWQKKNRHTKDGFKKYCGITSDSVREALDRMGSDGKGWHPELQRLYSRVVGMLQTDPDDPRGALGRT